MCRELGYWKYKINLIIFSNPCFTQSEISFINGLSSFIYGMWMRILLGKQEKAIQELFSNLIHTTMGDGRENKNDGKVENLIQRSGTKTIKKWNWKSWMTSSRVIKSFFLWTWSAKRNCCLSFPDSSPLQCTPASCYRSIVKHEINFSTKHQLHPD